MIEHRFKLTLFFLILISTFGGEAFAQQKKTTVKSSATTHKTTEKEPIQTLISPEELEDYKKRVGSLVSFLEFALNTIGNDSTDAEDKEVITTRSYLKFFANNKVQVEDDLDEHRLVKTYKPIQAYLQDVDFFFKHIQFELNIEEITPYFENVIQPYFKVALTRYIKGKTNDGDTIFNIKKRFIEINLDVKQKDLKIASIYTTPLNEADDQLNWWNALPDNWKQIFRKEMGAVDSVNLGQIKRLQNTQELNIANNKEINDLTPLNKISALKILNISNTNIYDLTPLRNLTNLEVLHVEGTLVKNFSALKYAVNLKELNFNNTNLDSVLNLTTFANLEILSGSKCGRKNIDFIHPLAKLKILNLSNNPLVEAKPLAKLLLLEQLDLSKTKIQDIEPISTLLNLLLLNLSNTAVQQLGHIAPLKKLRKLWINNTKIQTLDDLKLTNTLEKIYCDNTSVSKAEAMQFMTAMPSCIVIFESGQLSSWWAALPEAWKVVFRKYLRMDEIPTQDQLARLVNESEIDVNDNKDIGSLEPLKAFYNLKILRLNATAVTTLESLMESIHLEILSISNNKIKSLNSIKNLSSLKVVYCENTNLDSAAINSFRNARPRTVVVYRTAYLRDWWVDVSDAWRAVFKKYVNFENIPTDEQLHSIIAIDTLIVGDNSGINTLLPIAKMDRIKMLQVINCKISDLTPIKLVNTLLHIDLTKNGVKDLTALMGHQLLEKLILENTGVSELEHIATLSEIELLNIAGTQVNELDAIEKYINLKNLDISSTVISTLKPVEGNMTLKSLKCYNTKLSEKKVAKFKTLHPNCEVVFY